MNANEYLDEVEKRATWASMPGNVWGAEVATWHDENTSRFATPWEQLGHHDQLALWQALKSGEAASRTDVPKMAKALRAVLGIQAFTAGPDAEPGGDEDSWSLGFAQGLETARRAITEALEGEES